MIQTIGFAIIAVCMLAAVVYVIWEDRTDDDA